MPHLVEVQSRRLTVELAPARGGFRYADLPGMIGRVGTTFGGHGINISSVAVGHTLDPPSWGHPGGHTLMKGAGKQANPEQRVAAMVVTTDAQVPAEVVQEIVASEGFVAGWAVELSQAE